MIKIAIIGNGGMANIHAERFNKIRGCKLVACCDIDKKRAEQFAKKHGIKSTAVFTDTDKMLSCNEITRLVLNKRS